MSYTAELTATEIAALTKILKSATDSCVLAYGYSNAMASEISHLAGDLRFA